MAIIINSPAQTPAPTLRDDDSSIALLVGIIIVAFLAVIFFVYGLPALRNSNSTTAPSSTNTQQTTPPASGSGTQTPSTGTGTNY